MGLDAGVRAGGRSTASDGAAPPAERPTIESISEAAQREIRACPDSAAISCVAAALSRYAEALQTVEATTPTERRAHCRWRRAPGRGSCASR
jgi:hypothetical protein